MNSLLRTKLFVPKLRPSLVPRPHLFAKLDEGLAGLVTLVSAPAGFGKTTLVSGWLAQEDQRAAWLSLDGQDNHLHLFWAYMIAALQTAVPGLAAAAQTSLQNDSQTVIEPLLVSLLNDIAACEQRLLLVLDDLHAIVLPAIFDSLDFFLDHQPPNLQLLLLTREDPPLHLSRLRARGQLREIRAADLRFSAAETAVFLNQLLQLNCTDDNIATLTERTEGWAAGLQLAALALKSPAANVSQADFVTAFSGSDRLLTDYLIDEVLSRQDSAVQHFLRRTSILGRFNADLCAALLDVRGLETGEARAPVDPEERLPAADLLAEIERANLFLVPLDNERRWYRYHHLFAEFLRQRLRETEPRLLPSLQRAAARRLAGDDRPREALPYALAAPDYVLAAALIEQAAPLVLEREDAAIVQKWIEQLPRKLLEQRPFLNIYYACALTLTGAEEAIEPYLQTAAALSQRTQPCEQQTISGLVAAQRAYAAMFAGAHEAAETFAEQALASLPPQWMGLRSRTAAVLGNSHNYGGELTKAVQAYGDAVDWCESIGDVSSATFNLCSLAEIYLDQGRLSRAARSYQEALDFSRRHTGSIDNPFTGFAHIALARIARERNELDRSAAQLQHGITLCREWRQAYSLAIGLLDAGILWTARGEWTRARHALREGRLLARAASPVWGVGMVDALRARLALACGELDAAVQWAAACGFAPQDAPSYELTLVNFTVARVLVAQNRPAEALTLLVNIERLHQPIGRQRLVLEAIVWQAVAHAACGETGRAVKHLQRAVRLAEGEGYVRLFVDAGQPVKDLLVALQPAPFKQKLLAAFGDVEPAMSPDGGHPALLDPLNDRELEILSLMAAGMSNREIGDALFLSVNTIRWYASQIYSKMGVSGRGTAVARARELAVL